MTHAWDNLETPFSEVIKNSITMKYSDVPFGVIFVREDAGIFIKILHPTFNSHAFCILDQCYKQFDSNEKVFIDDRILQSYYDFPLKELPSAMKCSKCGSNDIYRCFHKKDEVIIVLENIECLLGEFAYESFRNSIVISKDCILHSCRSCHYKWFSKTLKDTIGSHNEFI